MSRLEEMQADPNIKLTQPQGSDSSRLPSNADLAQRSLSGVTGDTKPTQQKAEPMLVLDTTAKDGPRVHEQIINDSIQQFTFHPGKGLPLAPAIAVKFLKHDAFKRIDEHGNVLEWRRAPKQPDELGAGEVLKIADTETIARVDELSIGALLQRSLEMPGGERFTAQSKRSEMIDFIVATTIARKKAKMAPPEMGANDFVPEAEIDDDAEAA